MSDQARELDALAEALKGLSPACGVDRDRLMYEAGRASGNTAASQWFWPTCTAAALLIAVGLLAARWLTPPAAERIVYVQADPARPKPVEEQPALPEVPARDEAKSQVAVLTLRQKVLREGVDSLAPPAPVPAARHVGLAELLQR